MLIALLVVTAILKCTQLMSNIFFSSKVKQNLRDFEAGQHSFHQGVSPQTESQGRLQHHRQLSPPWCRSDRTVPEHSILRKGHQVAHWASLLFTKGQKLSHLL